jgi:hypothetical protein
MKEQRQQHKRETAGISTNCGKNENILAFLLVSLYMLLAI